jgi:putative transcriptional regulator
MAKGITMSKVYNQFKILLAQKEIRENRRIPYEEIKLKTGMALSTISAWSTNSIKRFDADTIAALCEYFGCDVGKLIVYESDNSGSN